MLTTMLAQFGAPGDILAAVAVGFCGWVGVSLFKINGKLAEMGAKLDDLPCKQGQNCKRT